MTATRDDTCAWQQPDDPLWRGGPIHISAGQAVAGALREYRANLQSTYSPPNFPTPCMQFGYLAAYTGARVRHSCQQDAYAECTCGLQQPSANQPPEAEEMPELSDAAFAIIEQAFRFSERKVTTNVISAREFMNQVMKLAWKEAPMITLGPHREAVRSRLYRSHPHEWQALLDALDADEKLEADERARMLKLARFGHHYVSRQKGGGNTPTAAAMAARDT